MKTTNRNTNDILRRYLLNGVNEQQLKKGSKKEVDKIRTNVANMISDLFKQKLTEREKLLKMIRAGILSIIAQFPVLTPIITAMLQVITEEDLGTRMDKHFARMEEQHGEQLKILNKHTEILLKILKSLKSQ